VVRSQYESPLEILLNGQHERATLERYFWVKIEHKSAALERSTHQRATLRKDVLELASHCRGIHQDSKIVIGEHFVYWETLSM
jgi:hypothetical protein